MFSSKRFLVFGAVIVAGCAGPVIETVDKGHTLPPRFDGALMQYFLARGEISASAAYSEKTKLLTVSIDPVKVIPDFAYKHLLSYSHGALATDEVDIQLENGLLKKVSSTSTDQTIAAVQAVNAILNQVAVTSTAIEKGRASRIAADAPPPVTCTQEIKVVVTKDVTYNRDERTNTEKAATDCEIELDIDIVHVDTLGLAGYPRGLDDEPTEAVCDRAVCFRLSGAYRVTATATLKKGNQAVQAPVTAKADILAPQAHAVGFVRFQRRRFVTNNVTLTFSNGMVSGLSAKDPSEIVGFLTLPTEILKGVAVVVQF